MRIFKNRGDIYFSKINKKKSAEQKILITALVVVIVFTIFFITALAVKYDFSAKKFFAPEDINVTQTTLTQEEKLPQVKGKNNFIILVSNEKSLLFTILLQVDMDNISYSVSSIKSSTVYDGKSLADIYSKLGSQNVKNAVQELVGTPFEYYISMDSKKFSEYFDEFGDFYYPVMSDIKFKNSSYSLKLKSGEQKLNGMQTVNLLCYYLDEQNNCSAANDLILNSLLNKVNSENLKKKEKLFKLLVTNSETNITVRDFSLASDKIKVLADDKTSAGTYSAVAQYEDNSISKESLQKIRGYFVK